MSEQGCSATGSGPKGVRRILTGDRPTGRLHLGHYVGSVKNRVELQHDHDTIVIVADLHVLTTKHKAEDISRIPDHVRGQVLDYVAAGIDPERTTIYLQSAIPEVYELNTLLANMVTVNRLIRLPSIKDMARAAQLDDDSMPFGLLGYPVLQAADILLPRAHLVPVGKDNLAHVEVTREIARRFNRLYGEVFPEPEALISDVASLPGTDGKGKMSSSAGNAILLSDDSQTVAKKIRRAYTDPNRVKADVPGAVEGNPVFAYHDAFNDDRQQVEHLKQRYRAGTVGDVEVKEQLVAALERFLKPMRQRLLDYQNDTGLVDEIIVRGTARMQSIARDTMREVRKAMGIGRTMTRLRRAAERREKKLRSATQAGENEAG